jgi:hypothetical protein
MLRLAKAQNAATPGHGVSRFIYGEAAVCLMPATIFVEYVRVGAPHGRLTPGIRDIPSTHQCSLPTSML